MVATGQKHVIELLSLRYYERVLGSGPLNTSAWKRRLRARKLTKRLDAWLSTTNVRLVKSSFQAQKCKSITLTRWYLQRTGLRPGMIISKGCIVRKKIYRCYVQPATIKKH